MKISRITIYVFAAITLFTVKSLCSEPVQQEQLVPSKLLVEGATYPLNVHNRSPRLSWHANVQTQSAYQIQVASSSAHLEQNDIDLWDSKKVLDERSVNLPYLGKKLEANQQAVWRVRIWSDKNDNPGPWSRIGKWEMGLLNQSDWKAQWLQVKDRAVITNNTQHLDWILHAANVHPNNDVKLSASKRKTQLAVVDKLKEQPTASYFRHNFDIPTDKKIIKAKLHSTAAGYYEIFLNGKKVDDRIMDPGQTDFDKRILYNTDEVSGLLNSGNNTVAVHLGSGWYDENIAFSNWHNPDSKKGMSKAKSLSFGQPKFIVQLAVTFADGSEQLITSNENWLSHASPVLKEGLFSGELYDANYAVAGWNNYHDGSENGIFADWNKVDALVEWPTQQLEPQLQPAIRAIRKRIPEKLYHPKEKVWVLDFGQNFTAVPTIHINKLGLSEGQAISLRYAEWADVDGNISQTTGGGAPLLSQVDTYVASGNDERTWTPTFTWHGFRYVEISGLSSPPDLEAFEAYLVRSDVEVAGKVTTSDPLINRIHDMALWTYESNLMGLPMDCPIRERAGWTGDAHAAQITGNYNFNMQTFWPKYLGDFRTSSHIAPAVVPGKRSHGGSFDWAVAEIMIAWQHYQHHGDLQVLQQQYESMLEYMRAAESKLDKGLLRIGYGDWCDPVPKPAMTRKRCNPQYTSHVITSSALLAHGAHLMSKIATRLNKRTDADYYLSLFTGLSAQFNKEFYQQDTFDYGSQTANAMALRFEITPKALRQSVADALNKDVTEKWNGHGSIGALGQTYVYRALSDYGYGDTAFGIFTAKGYPGYIWQFEKLQATSLWERKGVWDPEADPERKNPPGRSLSHPFHSGYDGWFYEGLGGIRPLEESPGFQHFVLNPVFPADLSSAQVSYTTGYGEIKSEWLRSASSIRWTFTVPYNSTAQVHLPNASPKTYKTGTYVIDIDAP